MKLSFLEISGLARLRTMPEFQLLLDALQADLDDAADRIYFADSDSSERRAVADWRALRTVISRLRGLPESVQDEAERVRNVLGFVPDVPTSQAETEILQNLLRNSTLSGTGDDLAQDEVG
jgi:hypothetical protein